jgi:hypothetical protein
MRSAESMEVMEVNMTRRKIMIMAVLGATVVGFAALVGFADHNAVFAADDEDQAALIKTFGSAKINLQQGPTASEQAGCESYRGHVAGRMSSNVLKEIEKASSEWVTIGAGVDPTPARIMSTTTRNCGR